MSGLREKLKGTGADPGTGPRRSRPKVKRPALVVALIGLVALGFVVSTVVLWRSDNNHGDKVDAGREAVAAAREGVPLLYTYRHDTVDEQLADVEEILADPFKEEFSNTARTRLAPIAKQLKIVVQAEVVGDAIVSADTDEVTTMLFVNQQTVLPSGGEPLAAGYSLEVTMEKHDDDWLISGLTVL